MKLLKSILWMILSVLTIGYSFAQNKPFKAGPAQTTALKKQAEECAEALMKQNYKQMVYYTYPPIVKAIGGPDKMVEKLTTTMQQMQSQGVAFKSVTIGDIKDIIKSQNDLYSVVQDILQMSMNGTVITASSYLLAYSHDNGLRWYFVDTAPMKNQNMKKMFPTYPPGLVIPQTHNPMVN